MIVAVDTALYVSLFGAGASALGAVAGAVQIYLITRRAPNVGELRETVRSHTNRRAQALVRSASSYVDLRLEAVTQPATSQGESFRLRASRFPGLLQIATLPILVIGKAGSGKSLMLLLAVRDIMNRQDSNSTTLYDFVSLAAWTPERRMSLEGWIVESVSLRWGIDRDFATRLIRTSKLVPIIEDIDHIPDEYLDDLVDQLSELALLTETFVVALRDVPADSAWTRLEAAAHVHVQDLDDSEVRQLVSNAASSPGWEELHADHVRSGHNLSWLFSTPLWTTIALRSVEDPAVLAGVSSPQSGHHLLSSLWVASALARAKRLGVRGTPRVEAARVWRWLATLARSASRFPRHEFTPMTLMAIRAEGRSKAALMLFNLSVTLSFMSSGIGPLPSLQFGLWVGLMVAIGQVVVPTINLWRHSVGRIPQFETKIGWLELLIGLAIAFVSASLLLSRGASLADAASFGLGCAYPAAWIRWGASLFLGVTSIPLDHLPLRQRRFVDWCADVDVAILNNNAGAFRFAHSELMESLTTHERIATNAVTGSAGGTQLGPNRDRT